MHPLSLLSDRLAVARLAADAPVPEWCGTRPFLVVSRTGEELSIVCPEERVPPSIQAERGFRAFKVRGPIDFTVTGLISSLTAPLAKAGISVLVLSTFDTEYVLVREELVGKAIAALSSAGFPVEAE